MKRVEQLAMKKALYGTDSENFRRLRTKSEQVQLVLEREMNANKVKATCEKCLRLGRNREDHDKQESNAVHQQLSQCVFFIH